MRCVYQREWFGIPFSSFTRDSSRELADAAFYEAFYRAFFQRYRSWEDLDPGWRDQKRAAARFLRERLAPGEAVLSIGCGLGWVEHCLWEMSGGCLDLHLTDMAPTALRWIKAELPPERVHVGEFPGCLPDLAFQLIYLVAVDYCLDQEALTGLLATAARVLVPGGRVLLISASFDEPQPALSRVEAWLKHRAAAALELARLYHRGQFWGWGRTQGDYHGALSRAGYAGLKDGFVPAPQGTAGYWIEGRLP